MMGAQLFSRDLAGRMLFASFAFLPSRWSLRWKLF